MRDCRMAGGAHAGVYVTTAHPLLPAINAQSRGTLSVWHRLLSADVGRHHEDAGQKERSPATCQNQKRGLTSISHSHVPIPDSRFPIPAGRASRDRVPESAQITPSTISSSIA